MSKNSKIKLWDIEATNLNSDFGYVLSIAVKNLGENEVRCYSVDDYKGWGTTPWNDEPVLREAAEDLSDAGAWVTWYGQRFDVPFVNSRLVLYGHPPMPPIPHIDGWRIAREKMKLHSNRLASVSSFLSVSEKTPLDGPKWIKAGCGDKKALSYVKEHNVQDVIVLEDVYTKIRPLITNGPNLSLLLSEDRTIGEDRCPICSATSLQKRGISITQTGRRQRYQCMACGGWSKGKVDRAKGVGVS